jgi:hypothetical protein
VCSHHDVPGRVMESLELSPSNREFLVKLCGMLGSSHDGERAGAALKASNFLRARALTWNEVIPAAPAPDGSRGTVRPAAQRSEPRTARSIDWRADLAMCQNCRGWLAEQERELVGTLSKPRRRPSATEAVKLAQMAARLRTEYSRNGFRRAPD